jgi:hypothetical protein
VFKKEWDEGTKMFMNLNYKKIILGLMIAFSMNSFGKFEITDKDAAILQIKNVIYFISDFENYNEAYKIFLCDQKGEGRIKSLKLWPEKPSTENSDHWKKSEVIDRLLVVLKLIKFIDGDKESQKYQSMNVSQNMNCPIGNYSSEVLNFKKLEMFLNDKKIENTNDLDLFFKNSVLNFTFEILWTKSIK